jgi:hypothetical protein
MQTKRTLHAAAVGNGRIFVCGGFDGMRDMATVEGYDPRTNAWHTKSSWNMTEGRSYLALCHAVGRIYAIGGQNRGKAAESNDPYENSRALRIVEAFDLYSERWLEAPPLEVGRIGLTASHLQHPDGEDFVYACGGSNGLDPLDSVERFSVTKGRWSAAPSMSLPRLAHTAAVVDGRLYVIGGYDGKEPLDSFQCFDPKIGEWGPLMKMAALTDTPSRPEITPDEKKSVRHVTKTVPLAAH